MTKPMDINQKGIAYTLISWDYPTPRLSDGTSRLESILRHGLLGTADKQRNGGFGAETSKENYEKFLAEGNKMSVFFNILGRTSDERHEKCPRIDQRNMFRFDSDSVGVLFDLSEFEEGYSHHSGRPLDGGLPEIEDGENGVYRAYDYGYEAVPPGEAKPNVNYGFTISPKIEPRYFHGIIFSKRRELTSEEHEKRIAEEIAKNLEYQKSGGWVDPKHLDQEYYKEEEILKFVEETDPRKLEERANEISREMLTANANNSDSIIPIYDIHGNMWGPEKIPYEKLRLNK
jgi:hypothetical protein